MTRFPEVRQLDHQAMEAERLDWWSREQIFQRSIEQRADAPTFTFYEGPPTANGRPGVHHVLARTIKDTFCRYKAMRGYRVDRKAGWDTHGLPVEIEVEKKLGLKSREDIEAYGIAEYNAACKNSVGEYTELWNTLTQRMAYWVDLDNPYVTYDNHYIESVWWLLKQLWDKGLIYKGHKIHWYSPGTGTVLSSHEVSLGYKEVADPAVIAAFPLVDDPGTAFLAWTTTPWTLISNLLLAVGPSITYVKAQTESGRYIVAEALAAQVLGEDFEVLERMTGEALASTRYTPPFDHYVGHAGAHVVATADYVTTEDGTGIVHTAPAFGADDFETARRLGVDMVNPIRRDGHFEDDIPLVGGLWFKDADKPICRDLKERGLLFKRDQYLHNYPHDWRRGTPLMSYPVESWFVRTTAVKQRLVELNEQIGWQPEHVGRGRFGEWLKNNVDWALSRHRFWGTPLPIWVSDRDPEQVEMIGSIEELKAKAGDAWPGDEALDLHRPFVDDITWPDGQGGTMRRVPEIIDVWFDSGAMPFAQWHYPFENKDAFERNFPADFIAEGLDQTRGWFYTLHAIATLVMDSVAYKNVVVNGLLLDAKGEKMSKSKGNTVDPFEALDQHGADAVRWYLMAASPPWDSTKYADAGIVETRRKLFMTVTNVYSFFASYANIDGIDPTADPVPVAERRELDRWMLSRLHSTTAEVIEALDAYNPTRAARAIESLVDALSNWYIRRSRPVFWAGKKDTGISDQDKRAAYQTTHAVLLGIARLMAPIAPFYADWLHQALLADDSAASSVHLADFPEPRQAEIDPALEHRMALARTIVSTTLALRNTHKLNVRQPLAQVSVVLEPGVEREAIEQVRDLILDEVNVEALDYVDGRSELIQRTVKPNFRVLGKRAGKQMKQLAGLIQQLDEAQINAAADGQPITVELGGQAFELAGDDLIIETQGAEGWAALREGGITVAVDTTMTPELRAKGLAREVINRIQNLRKQADFAVTDRIRVRWQADGVLAEALEAHGDWIARETLATELASGDVDAAISESFDLDGAILTLHVTRL
ncbi:MAG: isoleucine--tRNA ligase [Nevskiales bacterium]|nr:isoleucine--tRNA ligase [Nevskiales bacterium]